MNIGSQLITSVGLQSFCLCFSRAGYPSTCSEFVVGWNWMLSCGCSWLDVSGYLQFCISYLPVRSFAGVANYTFSTAWASSWPAYQSSNVFWYSRRDILHVFYDVCLLIDTLRHKSLHSLFSSTIKVTVISVAGVKSFDGY